MSRIQFQNRTVQLAIDYLSGRLSLHDIQGNDRVDVQRFLNTEHDRMIEVDQEVLPFNDLLEELGTDFPTIMRKKLEWDIDTLDLDAQQDDGFQQLLDDLDTDMAELEDVTGRGTQAIQEYIDGEIREVQDALANDRPAEALDRLDFLAQDIDARAATNAVQLTEIDARTTDPTQEKFDTQLTTRGEREDLMNFAERAYGGRELSAYEEEVLWTRLSQRRLQTTIWGEGEVDMTNPRPAVLDDWLAQYNIREPTNVSTLGRIERRLNTRLNDFSHEETIQIRKWLLKKTYEINEQKLTTAFTEHDGYASDVVIDNWIGQKTIPDTEFTALDQRVNPDVPTTDPVQAPVDVPEENIGAVPEAGADETGIMRMNGENVAIPDEQAENLSEFLNQYTPEELGPCLSVNDNGDLLFNPTNLPDNGANFMTSEFYAGMGEFAGNIAGLGLGLGIGIATQQLTGLEGDDIAILLSTLNLFAEASPFALVAATLGNAFTVWQKYDHRELTRQLNTHSEEHPLANKMALIRRNGKIYPAITRYVRRGEQGDQQIVLTYGTNPRLIRDATGQLTWKFDKVLGNLDQSYLPEGMTLTHSGFQQALGMKTLVENPLMPFCILSDEETQHYLDAQQDWYEYLENQTTGDKTREKPEINPRDVWGTVHDEGELNDAINRNLVATYGTGEEVTRENRGLMGDFAPEKYYETDQKLANAMDIYTDLIQTYSEHDPTLYGMVSFGQGYREQYMLDWDRHIDLLGPWIGMERNYEAMNNNYHRKFEMGYGTHFGMLSRFDWLVKGVDEDRTGDIGMLQRMQNNLNAAFDMMGVHDPADYPYIGADIPTTTDDLSGKLNQIYNMPGTWEQRNYLSQKLIYRYTLKSLIDSPYRQVRVETQNYMMKQTLLDAQRPNQPPLFYDYGEGTELLPEWAYNQEEDGQHEDGTIKLADENNIKHHADKSEEVFAQLEPIFLGENNWLTQATDENLLDLTNVPITHEIHEGIDTQPTETGAHEVAPIQTERPHYIGLGTTRPIAQPDVTVKRVGEYDKVTYTQSGRELQQRNVPRARHAQAFQHQYQTLRRA